MIPNDDNESIEDTKAYLRSHGIDPDALVARMQARIISVLFKSLKDDFDGLYLCEVCGDAYTRGRLCRSCAEQKAIDES